MPRRTPIAVLALSLPGVAGGLIYVLFQDFYSELPALLGYLCWPLLLVGLGLAIYVIKTCRSEYRADRTPVLVSFAIAINVIVCVSASVLLVIGAFLVLFGGRR